MSRNAEQFRRAPGAWSAALLLMCAAACGGEDDGEPSRADAGAQPQGQHQDPPDGGSARDASTIPANADGSTIAPDATPPDGEGGGEAAGDTFFRADSLVLAAPKLVAKPLLLPEQDITAQGQGIVDDALTMDGDSDGKVDLSLLIRFLQTKDPANGTGAVTTGGGLCAAPLADPPTCGDDASFPFQDPGLSYENAQDCQLTGVTATAAGACFVTESASLTMTLPILGKVPLRDGQVMGSWEGARIVNGQVRGFLPKSVAEATRLPDVLPAYLTALTIQPGTPLTAFLSDSELEADARGDQGWWFRLTFSAGPARFD